MKAPALLHNAPSPEASALRLACQVSDFLYALDRGDFGNEHRFSDGTESAYVTGLRDGLAAFEAADRGLVAVAHRRGQAVAADLCGGQ